MVPLEFINIYGMLLHHFLSYYFTFFILICFKSVLMYLETLKIHACGWAFRIHRFFYSGNNYARRRMEQESIVWKMQISVSSLLEVSLFISTQHKRRCLVYSPVLKSSYLWLLNHQFVVATSSSSHDNKMFVYLR